MVLTSLEAIAAFLLSINNQRKQFSFVKKLLHVFILVCLFKRLLISTITRVAFNNFANTGETEWHGLPGCILSVTIFFVMNIKLNYL